MSRELPFLGLSSVFNKISQKTLPFNNRPSQTSKNIGVLRALSTFSYSIFIRLLVNLQLFDYYSIIGSLLENFVQG